MTQAIKFLGLLFFCVVLASPVLGQASALDAPKNFSVKVVEGRFHGKWSPVPGATHYEVWTKGFGGWRYDDKEYQTSPLTSSFELTVDNDRTQFKIRAVDAGGQKSDFSPVVSAETSSKVQANDEAEENSPDDSERSESGIDIDAPAPGPPTSMLAVWADSRVIQLVWQAPEQAVKFSIEELIDGEWVSVRRVTFPKRTTALIEGHPMPGPYKFRIRSVGANGRASQPSRPTTARR